MQTRGIRRFRPTDEGPSALDSAVGNRVRGLDLDLRLREFEINQLTQRNNFFMIFQGVLIAGLVQSSGDAAPIISFSMCSLGVIVSVLQIGMAGGAKYWQSRWEAATRSSEIALVLEVVKEDKLAVQTFTHDHSRLTPLERAQIEAWNAENPNDQIENDTDRFLHKAVLADIEGSKEFSRRHALDWWVRKFVIAPKWSVSRIPIWVGAALAVFWFTVWLHTWRVTPVELKFPIPWLTLVPLK